MPHTQDTGGFFVCILQKVKELPEGAEEYGRKAAAAAPAASHNLDSGVSRGVKRSAGEMAAEAEDPEAAEVAAALAASEDLPDAKTQELPPMMKDDPFLQLQAGAVPGGKETVEELVTFFDLDESFPRGQLFSRSEQGGRIVMVSPAVSHLLVHDELREFKAINSGVRVFEKCNFMAGNRGCQFRLMQEGVHLMAPYVKRRKAELTVEDFGNLCAKKSVKIEEMASEETRKFLLDLSYGSVVLHCTIPGTKEVLHAVAERGEQFVQLFVDKEESTEMLKRLDPSHPALTAAAAGPSGAAAKEGA